MYLQPEVAGNMRAVSIAFALYLSTCTVIAAFASADSSNRKSVSYSHIEDSKSLTGEELAEFAEHEFNENGRTLSLAPKSERRNEAVEAWTSMGRRLENCTSFDENPRDPSDKVGRISQPWIGGHRKMCKLFVKWKDGTSAECSGSLVGPFHMLTAAHCTLNACKGGFAQEVLVKCGYGHYPGASDYAHLGTALATKCVHYRTYASQQKCSDGVSSGPADWDIQLCRLDRNIKHSHKYWGISFLTRTDVTVRGYPSKCLLAFTYFLVLVFTVT